MNQLPAVSQKCLRCPGEHSTERETARQRAAHVRGTPSSSLSQLEETSAEKLQRQHFLWSPKAFFSVCFKNSFENLFTVADGSPRALPSTSGCCRQTDRRTDTGSLPGQQPAHSSAPALLFQLFQTLSHNPGHFPRLYIPSPVLNGSACLHRTGSEGRTPGGY